MRRIGNVSPVVRDAGSDFCCTSRCSVNEGLRTVCSDASGGGNIGGRPRGRHDFFSLVRSGGRAHNYRGGLKFATWNVEGFTDVKLIELQQVMQTYGLAILCIQETHRLGVARYVSAEGYLVILSGSDVDPEQVQQEWAGVGFIIAPWAVNSVIGYCAETNRAASIRVKVRGGCMIFICAYAPHGGYAETVRQDFFASLSGFFRRQACNGPKILCGDLNARLHRVCGGEEEIIGTSVFGNPEAALDVCSNRGLLLEFCVANGLRISSTFGARPVEEQITFYTPAAQAMNSTITWKDFAQLDHILSQVSRGELVQNCRSTRAVRLASHHFILMAELSTDLCLDTRKQQRQQLDWSILTLDVSAVRSSDERLCEEISFSKQCGDTHSDLSSHWEKLVQSAHVVAREVLPEVVVRAQRPWIRIYTLRLIEQRRAARLQHDLFLVQQLSREIRRSAKMDRRVWLEERLLDNDWSEIRKLRSGGKQLGRLKAASGDLVNSEDRAETLADHYERIQWSVRPTAPSVSTAMLGPEIAVDLGAIQWEELQRAAKHLRTGRAAGVDDLPGEFWRLIAVPGSCLAD